MSNPTAIGQAGLDLIKSFEGCKLTAYPDPGTGGVPWTIGWGHTGPDVHEGLVWTQQQAEAQLAYDMVKYANQVTHALSGALTNQHQFDALVSFQYNTGSLASSTLLKKHKAGDYTGAALEFGKWTHAGGRVLPGLVRRRAAEAALYKSV